MRDLIIAAADGYPLAATEFAPEGPPVALVIVNPATAVPRRYYCDFARHLAERSMLAVTYDYRGIGDSRPPSFRKLGATMVDWGARDLEGVLRWTAEAHPDLPVLLVGHSAGGQLVPLAASRSRVRALLLVAAQSGYWRHWPSPLRWRRFIDWHVLMPIVATTLGRVPGWMGLGEDLPGGVAREWSRWCRHPDYLLRDEAVARRAAFASVRAPIRSYSFEDDDYGPAASVDALARAYSGADVERRHVRPRDLGLAAIGHFGFFRPKCRDSLWREGADWLLERTGVGDNHKPGADRGIERGDRARPARPGAR